MALSVDCGTYTLVCAQRDKDGNIVYKKEINAFLEMPIENRFIFNMMKNAGVPLIERPDSNIVYAVGQKAVDIAYTMNQMELKRPMCDGCINPKEKNAQQILNIMLHSLLESASVPNETLYYSVPANAINQDTDADYHNKVLEAMFKSFEDERGYKVNPFPINEALAIIYAEAQDQNYTALSCSFGGGMVNVCFAIFGAPVFSFAIANSGDWIDRQAAKATGETSVFINKEKLKLDLDVDSDSLVQKAIKTQYEIMLSKTVAGIKQGLEQAGNKARTDHPINIIVAGGTSLPNGFDKLFGKIIKEANLPINVGKIIKPTEPLFSVAKGCLLAAESAI